MTSPLFETRSVHELINHTSGRPNQFEIPAYQRGYRWKPTQVVQLLEDVREFAKRDNQQPNQYYCLQPLVLKDVNGVYEVVDGQQRLTTLLLILRHFNERLMPKYRSPLFNIQYETRPELGDFLESPSVELAKTKVDFFYLFQAIETIDAWFEPRLHEFEELKATLLNKTRVIWYELGAAENAVDAFTRLNVGKIPLTNDELIRALFLRQPETAGDAPDARQLQIAHEWDLLEKALQDDGLWYFLNDQDSPSHNRIGFLFSLVVELDGGALADQRYGVFHAYSRRFSAAKATIMAEWLRVKQVYMRLEEWYEDRRLYHIIGFLVYQGVPVKNIFQWGMQVPKGEFDARLRQEAFQRLIGLPLPADGPTLRLHIEGFLQGLEYRNNSSVKTKIRSTLLLFNLASLLESTASSTRFPFDNFKQQRWDIEHVRSVTYSLPKDKVDQERWLRLAGDQLQAAGICQALCARIEAYLEASAPQSEAFESLHAEVLEAFKENQEVNDSIANLALLDIHTNRGYGNAVFAVKRDHILKLDKHGIFVPLCTRNVFLKCYSRGVDHLLFWSTKDSEDYLKAMLDTLVGFFGQKQEPGV